MHRSLLLISTKMATWMVWMKRKWYDIVLEIVNKTYVEEMTDLHRKIFLSYNRKIRPIKNQSLPIKVQLHVYIMHFSVDQIQQTILLNGHIYMVIFRLISSNRFLGMEWRDGCMEPSELQWSEDDYSQAMGVVAARSSSRQQVRVVLCHLLVQFV